MGRKVKISACMVATLCILVFVARPGTAQGGPGQPEVMPLIRLGISPPLREIPAQLGIEGHRVVPLRPIPQQAQPTQVDSAVQTSVGPTVTTSPVTTYTGVGVGFTGPQGGFTVTAAPPDTNGAVGSTQYVQWVNLSYAVLDKATGQVLQGPKPGNSFWSGVTNTPCGVTNDGDPVVRYDVLANRWIMTQLSYSQGPPYYECIAISATEDATGSYYRYALQWSSTLPDYPKLGVWPDAYYMTFNLFSLGIFFAGSQVCALERARMLLNQDATVQCFTNSLSYPSLLPADFEGTSPPPPGSPNYVMNLGSNSLNLWRFHVDFSNPNNTTLTGPINIAVLKFNQACGGGTCVPQYGTSQQLDSLGDRLMSRLAYRNFSDHESLVVAHSVQVGGSRRSKGYSGIRWYEIRDPGGTPQVYQQATYAPDSSFRWMPSIAMDKVGNLAVGYSVSSSNMYPAIRYTGRQASEPLSTLESEATITPGGGAQLPNLSRWGDYSSMSLDPVDGCTFWYTTEYLRSNGTFNWSTEIAKFSFSTCQ